MNGNRQVIIITVYQTSPWADLSRRNGQFYDLPFRCPFGVSGRIWPQRQQFSRSGSYLCACYYYMWLSCELTCWQSCFAYTFEFSRSLRRLVWILFPGAIDAANEVTVFVSSIYLCVPCRPSPVLSVHLPGNQLSTPSRSPAVRYSCILSTH